MMKQGMKKMGYKNGGAVKAKGMNLETKKTMKNGSKAMSKGMSSNKGMGMKDGGRVCNSNSSMGL